MKELVYKVFEEKMKDGSIERIVSDKINEMVLNICTDQMRYNGPARKAMEEKLSPLIMEAVERCDLSRMVEKITMILNAALKGSDVEEYDKIFDSVRNLFGANEEVKKIREKRSVKMSEIFKEYKKYLQEVFDKDDFNNYEIEYDDHPCAWIDCQMVVSADEDELFRKRGYVVELSTDKSNDKKSGDIRFKLRWDYSGSELYLKADLRDLTISDLRYCPSFIIYLSCIEREWIRVDLDKEYEEDTVDIDCTEE